ncbi:MAG TPA: hypothetical protein VHE54_01305 [Puia sp.]|nr:hypothetical protein [Puia sp.]
MSPTHEPLLAIIRHLFQAESLEEVSRQRLESFVEEYPFFGIGHCLLSYKLQGEDRERFREATQRTSLYFSNPLWLQWQLANAAARNGETPAASTWPSAGTMTGETPEETAAESTFAAEPVTGTPDLEAGLPEGTFTDQAAVHDAAAEAPLSEQPGEQFAGTEAALSERQAEAAAGHDAAADARVQDPPREGVSEAPLPEQPAEAFAGSEAPAMTRAEEAIATSEEPAADQLLRSIEEAKNLRESLHKMNEDFRPEGTQPIHDEEASIVLDEPDQTAAPDGSPAAPGFTGPSAASGQTTEPGATREPAETPETPNRAAAPEPVAAVQEQAAHISQAPGLTFEPYHTIDYFASQGIRLAPDENPGDKLGKQLKSFTEWLKVMRRLPQKDREAVPDRVAEQAVQNFAAHSIESKDIVTEAMAEVLVKQGMRDRARVIYEKLSLLNPDKRAYFAAKIEQLNIP